MPRNGSGVYSKPAGTTAVPNTTIESAKFNQVVDDLVQDANNARPVTAGGTGGTSVATAQSSLQVDPKVVYVTKSADYTAVLTDQNAVISFSAAATLTLTAAATLGANWHIQVIADGGAVVIDPSGTETINGATTLTIPKGSSATVFCNGSSFVAEVVDRPSYAVKTANYTAVGADRNATLRFTSNATLSLAAAATLGSTWRMTVIAYNATVIIDPDASEAINGAATLTLRKGTTATIICDGTNFFAILSGGFLQTSSGFSAGYHIDPTGRIEQWGVVDIIGSSAAVITFPIAYPNAQMVNYASLRNGGPGVRIVSTDVGSPTQMTVFMDIVSSQSVAWRSIGY